MSKISFLSIVAVALLASNMAGAFENTDCGPRAPLPPKTPPKIATSKEESTTNTLALIDDDEDTQRADCAAHAPDPSDKKATSEDNDDEEAKRHADSDDYTQGDSGHERFALSLRSCQCIKAPCHCAKPLLKGPLLPRDEESASLDDRDEAFAARIVRRSSGTVDKGPKVDTVVVPSPTCQCIKAPCECAKPQAKMEE